jgi:hypothetical protein
MAFWELKQDATVLATLIVDEIDQPWFRCFFAPEPEFEAYRPYFEREAELLDQLEEHAELFDAWDDLLHAIARLGVTLVSETGEVIEDFWLHVEESYASFRY